MLAVFQQALSFALHPMATTRKRTASVAAMLLTPGASRAAGSTLTTPAAAPFTPSRRSAASSALTSPAPPPLKRGKFAEASKGARPSLRGLTAEMPALWARVFFTPTPEGSDEESGTAGVVNAFITETYNIPASLPVPLSGLTGEERLRIAYYQGALVLKEGKERGVLLCEKCLGPHTPWSCTV